MPRYSFECEVCSLRFERAMKMGEHQSHECPSCKGAAPRVLDSFGFSFAKGTGAPANSGVHDHDYPTADKAVGRSADERWAVISEREKVKNEARRQGGTHALIRHTHPSYLDYEPMSDAGLNARRNLALHALETARAAKRK